MLRRWVLPDTNAERVSAVAAELGITTPAAKVLVNRGFGDPDAARRFLRPSFDELHDPLLMRDMGAALDRLQRAICDGEKNEIKTYKKR